MRWKLIFPWIEVEDGGNDKLYCRECRSAKLKNAFTVGKNRPSGGWKLRHCHYDNSHCDKHIKTGLT